MTDKFIEIKPVRRVSINSENEWSKVPKLGLGTTPGGTMFGTTPGGTRIVYDRIYLLAYKASSLNSTPPKLPQIPGVTTDLRSGDGGDMNPISEQDEDISSEPNSKEEPKDQQNIVKRSAVNNRAMDEDDLDFE